jgi:hypothetical protein
MKGVERKSYNKCEELQIKLESIFQEQISVINVNSYMLLRSLLRQGHPGQYKLTFTFSIAIEQPTQPITKLFYYNPMVSINAGVS